MDTAIHLPSLLCIARQLRSLTLLNISRLHTGAQTGAQSDTLAAGWDSLRRLRLERVCVDAAFGAVHLPSLELLCLLRVRDAHGAEYFCANAFAAGCPRCTNLEYSQPLPNTPTDGLLCKDFSRVQDLALDFRLSTMSGREGPALPTTVSSLTFGVKQCHLQDCLELHDMLALAAAWISVGVPLQQLCFLACAPSEFHGAPMDEQQQRSAAGPYAAMCASLHGVTRVQLLRCACSLQLVNAMVTALPDLKQLSIDVDWVEEDRPILCSPSGLESLELNFYFESDGDRHLVLGLNLSDNIALHTCIINVSEYDTFLEDGDSVEVQIVDHDAAASIVPNVEIVRDGGGSPNADARMTISLGQGRARLGRRRAADVTFVYEKEEEEDVEDATWRAMPVCYF